MRICSFVDQSRAGLVINLLKENGIAAFPLNTSAHVGIGGADHWYYIEVPEEESEKARLLLSEMGYEKDLV